MGCLLGARIYRRYAEDRDYVLYKGDCQTFLKRLPDKCVDLTVTSPPYFMSKDYDKSTSIADFEKFHEKLLPEIVRVTKDGGSICWQVGNHVKNGIVTPLDYVVHGIFNGFDGLKLRNRIVWTFGHGLHGSKRFSGRHETILWYTKGDDYRFDLDSVRVRQKYPGKRHYKGKKKGEYSCNPKGKNPSDVWDIPNVKANHVEKTNHPCQFPVALVQRLIRALVPDNGMVFDPFIGSGTTGVAAIVEHKCFLGCELDSGYYHDALARCEDAIRDRIKYRPEHIPVYEPKAGDPLTIIPAEFRYRGEGKQA